MSDLFQFGCHRVLEPANSFPQPAWKLNNTMCVDDNEMLVDVQIINVNSTSFSQIHNSVNGNPLDIKNRILEIVRSRGKLQNPVTGTGGILYGRVEKIGNNYPNPFGLRPGDMVITLASLSLTPLKIDTIHDMDIFSGQFTLQGKAIVFDHMPLIKVDPNLQSKKYSLELLISVMDEAGAPRQTWKLARPNDNVLIMGANGKLGLLCAHAAREKMGSLGNITGVVKTQTSKKILEKTIVYDEIICCDAFNTVAAIDSFSTEKIGSFDLIINCMTVSGSEMLSLVLTRNKGSIFFASLANSHKITALTSESIGKDLDIIGYTGFVEGHAAFTTQLLDNHPDLIRLLSQLYKHQKIKYADKTSLVFGSRGIEHILKDSRDKYVFVSSKIQEVLSSAVNVAKYDCTTLITGESGVGKEIIADIIHKASERNPYPLIKINCGTIPANLLESELFGYEKGAFSGASEKGKKGFFELAHNGTLFLDEVGELKMELQVKILRAIQEQQIYRVGGTRPITVNVRIITATNRSLEEMIKNGEFREDLFYRLNVFPIKIPSLKQRKKDIIPLVEHFIKKYNTKFKLHKTIEQMALENLVGHDWPGNIRELQNIVQRILINTKGDHITLVDTIRELASTHSHKEITPHIGGLISLLNQTECKILKATKEEYKTTRKMAHNLGLSQTTLVRKLKKHQL